MSKPKNWRKIQMWGGAAGSALFYLAWKIGARDIPENIRHEIDLLGAALILVSVFAINWFVRRRGKHED